MAELIQKQDTLNEGRVKINAAITDAEQAKVTADGADDKATQALAKSESTQTQLDTIVINGDSSVEAAQARVDEKGVGHSTLKERIDDGFTKVTSQLNDTAADSTEAKNKATEALAKANNPLGSMQTQGQKVPLDMLGDDVIQALDGSTVIELSRGYFENNRGVTYPLKNKVKDGVLNSVSNRVKNVVLGATVINPKENKFYAISYISNGFSNSYGITIIEYDKSNYATNSEDGKQVLIDFKDMPFSAESGIVTRTINLGSIVFIITVDYDEISGVGLNVSNTETGQALGCVIDESNYIYSIEPKSIPGFEANRGFDFPLRNIPREGEMSPITDDAKNAILDAKIFGAKAGKYYRLTMIANGYVSNDKERWGISMQEWDIDQWHSGGSSNGNVFSYNNENMQGNLSNATWQKVSDTIETITVDNGEIACSLTIDRSVISATSHSLFMNLDTPYAPTAIIDPSNYFF